MATIHQLNISNFRGIESFSHVFTKSNLICLIGRGDSGKSSILEAISFVLSPSWNISLHDNDFTNCNTKSPIEIEATLLNLPNELLVEHKYGLYIKGWDSKTNSISNEIEDHHQQALTIKLTVAKDLEPHWTIIKGDQSIIISAYDRAKLNVFMVSDYLDKHFSWSKGSPLYALLNQGIENEKDGETENIVLDALRKAKSAIDQHPFDEFESATKKIKESASLLGMDIEDVETSIDVKDLLIKEGKVSLHGAQIPYRLKGKGSKRLISIAVQLALVKAGGIILIDEIEQGLEPDRAQHLVRTLKTYTNGQIFITTHSRDVIVELSPENLYLVNQRPKNLNSFDPSLQACLRSNPEAYFAKKILLCEGPTEIGICRALDKFKVKNGHKNATFNGVKFANGVGNNLVNYAKGFKKSSFEVQLFCDSDDIEVNKEKAALKAMGIEITDWDGTDCLETAIVKGMPYAGVVHFLYIAAKLECEEFGGVVKDCQDRMWEAVKAKFGASAPLKFDESTDSPELRIAIGAVANKKKWYKNISKGEHLGDLVFHHIGTIGKELKERLNQLSLFIDTNGL